VDEAIRRYREAIRLDPKHALVHNNLGLALGAKGDLDGAIRCYREAIRLDPKHALAHNNLGNALKSQGKEEEAIVCFRNASAADPRFAEAHNNLGAALYRQGKVKEASACFRAAIAADPRHAQAHSNLGAILCDRKHDYDGAIACFRRAIALDPRSADTHFNLGNALKAKGRLEEAIACYQNAIRLKKDIPFAHYHLGTTLYARGRLDEAITCFRQAIRLKPDNLLPHPWLVTALSRRGRYKEAEAACRAALEDYQRLADKYPHARAVRFQMAAMLDRLAAVLLELGDREGVLALADRYRAGVQGPPADLWSAACLVLQCVKLVQKDARLADAKRKELARNYADRAVELLRQAVKAGWNDAARLMHDPQLSPLRGREDFKKLIADLLSRARLRALAQVAENHKKLAANPDNPQLKANLAASQRDLGSLHWQMGRHAEAIRDWQQARKTLETASVRLDRDTPDAKQALAGWHALGFAYVKAGLWAEASACLSRPLNPDARPSPRNLLTVGQALDTALLRLRTGDSAGYRQDCAAMRGLLEKSDKPDLTFVWACALEHARVNPEQLVKWAKQEESANPSAWSRHILALACYRAGRFKEASAHATRLNAVATWPGHNMNWPVLAMAEHRLGHTAQARRWLEQANQEWRRRSPLAESVEAANVLPFAFPPWWSDERYWHDWLVFEVLLAEANALILGNRGEADCLDLLHQAYLHTRLGEASKADKAFQAALSGRARDARTWLARGRVYRLLGDRERARADFVRAHELNPDDPGIQKEYQASGGREKSGR
jgi:tetratricopeptide (TPR) repeat protein